MVRWYWLGLASLVLAGCSSGPQGDTGPSRSAATTTTAARASATSSTVPERPTTTITAPPEQSADVAAVSDLLGVLAPYVPIPEDARSCVAAKVADDPALVSELRKTSAARPVPDGVMAAGSACMQELHALPALLDGLDEQVPGGLSDAQRECVEDGYRKLEPAARDAVVADALGGRGEAVEGVGQVKAMLQDCGVKVGG